MISKSALFFARYFASKDIYGNDKINIYKYGFELLISTLINTLCILFISIALGMVFEAIFFCTAFIILRLIAGGYHAKHHWSCILCYTLIFIGFITLYYTININFVLYYSLAAVIISFILVWLLAPVEAVNKPLRSEKKKVQRKKSLILSIVNIMLTAFLCTWGLIRENPFFSQLLLFYTFGALAASLSLVMAVVTKRFTKK